MDPLREGWKRLDWQKLSKSRSRVPPTLFCFSLIRWFFLEGCARPPSDACPGSFINVLIHMPGFCPSVDPELSVDEEHFGCRFATNFFKACPDLCDAEHLRCSLSPHECVGSRFAEPSSQKRQALNWLGACYILEAKPDTSGLGCL